MDDYLRDFVQESDDNITDLNNALLDLENDPSDENAMDAIFRTAHTIKGNCGAMGFTKAADLAHAMEDLLDEMRAGRIAVTPETMDEVFDGVDTLEQMIEEVKEHEEPQSEPDEVISRLRGVIEDAPGPDVMIEEPTDEQIEKTLEHVEGPEEPEQLVYHVRLAVSEQDVEDEGMLVLEALADAFDVLATNPPQNVIRNEDYGGSFDAVISSAIGEGDIRAALEAVDQVDDVIVTDVSSYVEKGPDSADDIEVEDMEVEELLDSVSEFDDIDAMAEEIAEEEAMEELGDAGTFDELEVEGETAEDIEIEGLLEDEELAADDEIEESDLGDMEDLEPDEPEDSHDVFKEIQSEVDQVGYEELEPELEELEFDEFSSEDELTFDELVDEAEVEGELGPSEEDDLEEFGSEFDEQETGVGEFDDMFEEQGGETVSDDELDDVLAEASDTTVGEGEEVSFDELVDEVEAEGGSAGEPSVEPDELDVEFDDDAADDEIDFGDMDLGEPDSAEADAGGFDDVEAAAGDAEPDFGSEFDEPSDDDLGVDPDDLLDEADDLAADASADAEAEPSAAESSVDAETADEPAEPDVVEVEAGEPDAEASDDDTGVDVSGRDIGEIDTIRVNVDEVDSLLNQVEQLVTNRLRLRRSIVEGDLGQAQDELDELETLTMRMQDTVMDIRLVPLGQVVGNLPRVVRDLARDQGKQVDFDVKGGDVELDRRILSELGDPLLHLVRNAVDHGIESPDEREAAGKPATGDLSIRARRTRDRVTIEVVDDGRGLDADAIAETAREEGLRTDEELAEMDDSEIYELIFEPGFSTAKEVTGVSGRGVGMDVVRETVQSLDGAVSVQSTPGEGTTISLRVPVSVAIVRVLFVEVGGEEYGIPVKNVDEISRMAATETVDGEEVLTHGDQVYPLIRLDDALEVPAEDRSGTGMLIRMNDDVRQVALHCDDVMRQEEVVVKPYEGLLSGIAGLSGAAVLGEGDVVNILDVETL